MKPFLATAILLTHAAAWSQTSPYSSISEIPFHKIVLAAPKLPTPAYKATVNAQGQLAFDFPKIGRIVKPDANTTIYKSGYMTTTVGDVVKVQNSGDTQEISTISYVRTNQEVYQRTYKITDGKISELMDCSVNYYPEDSEEYNNDGKSITYAEDCYQITPQSCKALALLPAPKADDTKKYDEAVNDLFKISGESRSKMRDFWLNDSFYKDVRRSGTAPEPVVTLSSQGFGTDKASYKPETIREAIAPVSPQKVTKACKEFEKIFATSGAASGADKDQSTSKKQ